MKTFSKSLIPDELKVISYTLHWPIQRWLEYEPLLSYCRDKEARLLAYWAEAQESWEDHVQMNLWLSLPLLSKWAPSIYKEAQNGDAANMGLHPNVVFGQGETLSWRSVQARKNSREWVGITLIHWLFYESSCAERSPTLFLLIVLGKAILQLLITSRSSLPRFLAVETR